MKRNVFKLFLILSIIMVFFLRNSTKQVQAQEYQYAEAIIVRAEYQGDQFILELEIDGTIYNGRLSDQFTNDDYLSFHHNVGMVVEIIYELDDGAIIIYSWQFIK